MKWHTGANKVLFVDDSVNLLSAVRRSLRGKAELVIAENASSAFTILNNQDDISVVVSDQNMPGMKGTEFLNLVAEKWPQIIRIMQTGNQDQETAIAAINNGPVFRFLRKPYDPQELLEMINDAQDLYDLRQVEQTLLRTTLAGSVKMLTELLGLVRPDLFAEAMQVRQLTQWMSKLLKIPNAWELDIAAMLYPLGLMTISDKALEKRKLGERLSHEEAEQILKSSTVGGELIGRIPRLENVAKYVTLSRKGYDGSGYPADGPRGAAIPIQARVLHIIIDVVELSTVRQISLADAMLVLKLDKRAYDNELFELMALDLGAGASVAEAPDRAVVSVSLHGLHEGDVLMADLRNSSGELMLAGGVELSAVVIKRLQRLAEEGKMIKVLSVSRQNKPAQKSA